MKPIPRQREPTRAEREELIRRYREGATMDALAREVGRSDDWLRPRMQLWGVHIRGRSESQQLRWKRHNAARRAAP
ncbi:hypothetical protein [Kitasatospora sp. MBT66]|uniref:hypothetical protein n=1 Tax=Kitasatospora sp. MBT66 TaxID=1444769 RepID=UPI0005B854E5|nr:hypothetical protein [Kitasatospora sp. MBT66]